MKSLQSVGTNLMFQRGLKVRDPRSCETPPQTPAHLTHSTPTAYIVDAGLTTLLATHSQLHVPRGVSSSNRLTALLKLVSLDGTSRSTRSEGVEDEGGKYDADQSIIAGALGISS